MGCKNLEVRIMLVVDFVVVVSSIKPHHHCSFLDALDLLHVQMDGAFPPPLLVILHHCTAALAVKLLVPHLPEAKRKFHIHSAKHIASVPAFLGLPLVIMTSFGIHGSNIPPIWTLGHCTASRVAVVLVPHPRKCHIHSAKHIVSVLDFPRILAVVVKTARGIHVHALDNVFPLLLLVKMRANFGILGA